MDECHYCGGEAETRDHIVPRVLRGSNAFWNIVPACRPCNCSKGGRFPLCECERCEASVRRHLADPETRAFIVGRLTEQQAASEESARRAVEHYERATRRTERLKLTLRRIAPDPIRLEVAS